MQPNDSQPLAASTSPLALAASIAATAAPLPLAASHTERRINQKSVRDLCGGISYMTLWRWLNDPAMGFPRPVIIGRLRYWREADIVAWLASREVAA